MRKLSFFGALGLLINIGTAMAEEKTQDLTITNYSNALLEKIMIAQVLAMSADGGMGQDMNFEGDILGKQVPCKAKIIAYGDGEKVEIVFPEKCQEEISFTPNELINDVKTQLTDQHTFECTNLKCLFK